MRPGSVAALAASLCLAGSSAAAGSARRCRILLTNDDGVTAPGLRAAYDSLSSLCDVVISAPSIDQSGASHAIFHTSGTRVREIRLEGGVNALSVEGSPAEAAAIGVYKAGDGKVFDLIVSGINRGENLGLLNLYSGTVNAAMEGVVRGVPGIAVSAQGNDNYAYSATFLRDLAASALRNRIPPGVMLNVNIPRGTPKGVRVVASGGLPYTLEGFDRQPAPDGTAIYKPRLKAVPAGSSSDDIAWFARGWITIAPLAADRTAYGRIGVLKRWGLKPPPGPYR
jgi:5'-nucleotidase